MKSKIISLILFAFFSIVKCSTDYYVKIEDGIIQPFECMTQEDPFNFNFYISISTQGFDKDYQFRMRLNEPNYAFADCTIFASINGPLRSTSESEQMKCSINVILFPLFGRVSLLTDYYGDGSFELDNWKEVIGLNNVVMEDTQQCYPQYTNIFEAGFYTERCTSERGTHELTIMGSLEPKSQYEVLTIFPYLLVDDSKYRGATCTLSYIPQNSGDDYELKCQFEDGLSARFFPTMAYNEETGILFYIKESNNMQLSDCFSSFLKFSSLILLSFLLF